MDDQIKQLLGTTKFKPTGQTGGGCISTGSTYEIDNGQSVFVKINHKEHAKLMFDGEHAGLEAILATNTVIVPKSFGVVQLPGSKTSGIVLEHINMKPLKNEALLGQQLAELHLNNQKQLVQQRREESNVTQRKPSTNSQDGGPEVPVRDLDSPPAPITRFGFDTPTSCGYISMNNEWCDSWTRFYIAQRIQPKIDMLMAENSSNRSKLPTLWADCQAKMEMLLNDAPNIVPALLHGDLWSGNVAANDQDQPVIFDAAVFYGHSEFDLAIGQMFGGFSTTFEDAYHKIIPKFPGFNNRLQVYELFHHLNHWAHFGSGYESGSISLMKTIGNFKL